MGPQKYMRLFVLHLFQATSSRLIYERTLTILLIHTLKDIFSIRNRKDDRSGLMTKIIKTNDEEYELTKKSEWCRIRIEDIGSRNDRNNYKGIGREDRLRQRQLKFRRKCGKVQQMKKLEKSFRIRE